MPLLDAGNREFSLSVTRDGWHFKSARLDKLELALRNVQANRANAEMLRYLYKRLYRWIETNPNEYAVRGALVGQLAYQIERRASEINAPVNLQAAEFRRVTFASADRLWTPLNDLNVHIDTKVALWSTIRITDIPTGVPGVYNFIDADVFSEGDRVLATQETGGHHVELNRQYWLRLGRRVLTAQNNDRRYGRCFSCAAAVIFSLITDPAFDNYMIEHVGSFAFDHHLVFVGRSNATGVNDLGLNPGREQWKWTTIVIDAWQENLNRAQEPPAPRAYAGIARHSEYAMSHQRWFCAYTTANRGADRAFAAALPAPVRHDVNLQVIAAAREAARLADAAAPPRNDFDRVVGPDGRVRWVRNP